MANATMLQFEGGLVELPQPTVAELRENAGEWLGMAGIAFAEGECQAADGDLDVAIEQLAYCVNKINTARARLIEARQMRSAESGS